jgi:Rod binding domain-containing protein
MQGLYKLSSSSINFMDSSSVDSKYVGMDTSMLMEMAHSKHASDLEKNAAVSQQFESVLVKQFLKEALKPMFKGVFNEDGGAHRMYRHFFTDAISESIATGGGFGVSNILQQQLNRQVGESSAENVKSQSEGNK